MRNKISSNLLVFSGLFVLVLPLIFWSPWPSLGNALRESLLAVSAIIVGIVLAIFGLKRKLVLLRKPDKISLAFLILALVLLVCFLFNNTLFNPIKNLDISSRGSEFALFLTLFFGLVIILFYPKGKIKSALFLIYGVSWLLSLGALLALWGKGRIFIQLFLGSRNSAPALMSINEAAIFAAISVISGLFLFSALIQNKKLNKPWGILISATWFLPLFLILVLGVRFVTIPLFFGVFGTFLTRSIVLKKKVSALAIILLIFIFVLAIGGPKIRLALKPLPVEVALSQKTSLEITERYFSQNPKNLLFGEGRGGFPFSYEKFRTPAISQTPFWSLTFPLGASEFWTFLIETGILGMVGLFILVGTVFWSFLKFIKKRPTEIKKEGGLVFAVFFGLFSFFVLLFFLYPFSLGLWIFFIISLSFLAVTLSSDKKISWTKTTFRTIIFLVSLILVLLASFYPLREALMEGFIAKAQSTTDLAQKEKYLNLAQKVFSSHPRPYLIESQIYSQIAFQILSQPETLKEEDAIPFLQGLLTKINQNGERIVNLEKRDPRIPLLMADIYLNLAQLGVDVEKAVELSEHYADLSIQRAPQSALPFFKKAQAKFVLAEKFKREGNEERKKEIVKEIDLFLKEALNRSPGFLGAREMQVTLADFQEDYSGVIELGKSFLIDQPRNTEVRYLVAKAYYQREEWNKAESQTKVILNQDRAHFPSLILAGKLAAREENFPRAIDFFERARAQAPENKELPEILAALRRAENPFATSSPIFNCPP